MEDQTELREALVRALAGRLRPVCMSWPPELFDTMIRKLANITLKYDYHQAMSTHLATAESTKLLAELRAALERSARVKAGEVDAIVAALTGQDDAEPAADLTAS